VVGFFSRAGRSPPKFLALLLRAPAPPAPGLPARAGCDRPSAVDLLRLPGAWSDQRRRGLGIEGGAYEIMAVAIVAFQGDETGHLLFKVRGIDGKPADVEGRGLAWPKVAAFGFEVGQQRHAARPPRAGWRPSIACSRVLKKGYTSPFYILSGLMALPASTSTSPIPRDFHGGRRMACARSPISRAPLGGRQDLAADGRRALRCGDCRR